MRKPVFAGFFYPASAHALTLMIEECFKGSLGPGALPDEKKTSKNPVLAVITPHAGYAYSGMAAAWSFKRIAEAPLPDLFILFGPNHHSCVSGISIEDWLTPLGRISVDKNFAKMLVEFSGKAGLRINDEVHSEEHSLEVQLPFLQFCLGEKIEKTRILPILVSHDLDLDSAADALIRVIKESQRKVIFIVSSDFTHYGSNYGFVPFKARDRGVLKKLISELDKGAINFILACNDGGFADYVDKTQITICGFLPILLLLKVLKKIGFKKASLEKYYVSGDITGDYSNTVSYASIVFV